MIPANLSADEQERLQDLYDYSVLDTEAEKAFDDLTQLASQICQTPIALISLVDHDRQWFKSKQGLDADETHRDHAFCAHAILEEEIFEIADASKDPRFHNNPLVTGDPNIRFYAGAQLVTPNGHAIGTLCAIGDKPAELNDQQRNALAILSREVISQLELRKRIKQADQENQRKTEFLSNISHELRTPLNAVLSFAQLLGDSSHDNLQPQQSQYIQHIQSSAEHMLNMVNEFLDLQKIEAGKLELNQTIADLRKLNHQLYGLLENEAQHKNVKLDMTVDDSVDSNVMLDQTRFRQIVINLVNNAIKFCQKDKTVECRIFQNSNQLILTVKDQGLGIPLKDQSRILQKYERLSSHSDVPGTGLGLSITLSLVELMQGKFKLHSEENKGTLVKVTIPLSPIKEDSKLKEIDSLHDKFNPAVKILVVEDNHINQLVAIAVFDALGLRIDVASSGEEAIELCQKNSFDLVFMDLNMPGMDGYTCAEKLNKMSPSVPIIALTADIFAVSKEQLKHHHFAQGITKPIDVDRLANILVEYAPRENQNS